MKNLNKNPLVWFVVVLLFGWFAIGGDYATEFIMFILAVIVSKQIEITSKKD